MRSKFVGQLSRGVTMLPRYSADDVSNTGALLSVLEHDLCNAGRMASLMTSLESFRSITSMGSIEWPEDRWYAERTLSHPVLTAEPTGGIEMVTGRALIGWMWSEPRYPLPNLFSGSCSAVESDVI